MTGVDRRRQDPARPPEQPTGFVERVGEAAEGLGQADEHEVAEGMAFQLAAAEPVLERGRPHAVVSGQRHQAAADVARRRHAEVASEPARRTTVVGDAHDRGDVPAYRPHRAQRGGEPVTATERDDALPAGGRQPRSTSRWWTRGETPSGSRSRASSVAITTLR